jgi:hypothetical protein
VWPHLVRGIGILSKVRVRKTVFYGRPFVRVEEQCLRQEVNGCVVVVVLVVVVSVMDNER